MPPSCSTSRSTSSRPPSAVSPDLALLFSVVLLLIVLLFFLLLLGLNEPSAAPRFPCSAYAKLGMISSALSSDSDDVTKLLNVSLDLIAPSTKSKAAADATRSSAAASKPGRGLDTLKGGAELADSERAVEVLSFLVSKTKVM